VPFALKQYSIRYKPIDPQSSEPVYSTIAASTCNDDFLKADLSQYPLT